MSNSHKHPELISHKIMVVVALASVPVSLWANPVPPYSNLPQSAMPPLFLLFIGTPVVMFLEELVRAPPDEPPEENPLAHWKTDILGGLVMLSAPAYILTAEWGDMWSLAHIKTGIIGAAILLIGFGITRRWGFRD